MTASCTTSLYCDRDTRPEVDGIRTVCGLQFGPSDLIPDRLRYVARQYGWVSTGVGDYCPTHARSARQETA